MAPNKNAAEISLKALVFADKCYGSSGPVFEATNFLHGVPVLDWQLAALARGGVKEAVVLSSHPIDNVWMDPLERMKITKLTGAGWTCEGDALREVEARSDIRPQDDFVIVRAGAVFNIPVSSIVDEHKKRRAKDRNWLLSAVLRRGTAGVAPSVVIAVDEDGALLRYAEQIESQGVEVNIAGGNIEMYTDVVDTGVDVCAPELLLEFKENFDYDRVRALTIEKLDSGDAETMGNRMFARFTDSTAGEYAARIESLATLKHVSQDVLNGWLEPLAHPAGLLHFEGDIFVPKHAKRKPYADPAWKGSNVVLGTDVCIEPGASVRNSVIGDGTVVSEGCVISGCILGKNVKVDAGAYATNSIIETNVVVKKGAKIPTNCYLDSGVVVGEQYGSLKSYSLVSTKRDEDFLATQQEFDEEDELVEGVDKMKVSNDAETAKAVSDDLGESGIGRVIDHSNVTDDPFFGSIQHEGDGDDSEEDEFERAESNMPDVDDENAMNGAADSTGELRREIFELLEKDRLENVAMDNTLLEANSLRLSYDVTFSEMLVGVVLAIARNAVNVADGGDGNYFAAFKSFFERYAPLTEKYVSECENDAVAVVGHLANEFSGEGKKLKELFPVLYECDVIEEEPILEWADGEKDKTDSPLIHVQEFVEWLREDDDDDDDDDE